MKKWTFLIFFGLVRKRVLKGFKASGFIRKPFFSIRLKNSLKLLLWKERLVLSLVVFFG